MKTMADLQALEQALGYQFRKTELIIEALTHRSHHHEFGDSYHNERLEFLGDAVLDLCVSEIVMDLSPTTDEGHLSKVRSQLVSEHSLAKAARRLNLGRHVRLGRGEDLSGGRERDALLADTLEAVIAAVYRDGGIDTVKPVISKILEVSPSQVGNWAEASVTLLTQDYKSRLQEFCQSAGFGTPTYLCRETTGPDHLRIFTMGLMIQNLEIIRATSLTKKDATQKAARLLLELAKDEIDLEKYLLAKGLVPMRPRGRLNISAPKSPRKKEIQS